MNAFDEPQQTRRDRWGRYLVVPPNGGKPKGYTRATTVAKALDDTSNLMAWSCRMTALGLAQRPDLLALVTTTDDKNALNDIVERAKEAGGATARRDLGTALHAMIEQSYTTPGYVAPDAYAKDVAAVRAALDAAGLRVVGGMQERMCVVDRLEIAGTFDMLVADGAGRLVVADVKTGSSIEYGALGFAVQLAIYANADNLYRQGATPVDDVREPMPNVDKARALIIHVEPGSGRCTLHDLDIATGLEALHAAIGVREFRKRKDLLRPLAAMQRETMHALNVMGAQPVDRLAWLTRRVEAIKAGEGGLDALVAAWPADLPTFKAAERDGHTYTDAELDAITGAIEQAEAACRMPFETPLAEPAPRSITDIHAALLVRPPVRPDEGGGKNDAEYSGLERDLGRLVKADTGAGLRLTRWRQEAEDAGYTIAIKNGQTWRRYWLGHIIVSALTIKGAEDLILDFVSQVRNGSEEPFQSTTRFGALLGTLAADEAKRVAELCAAAWPVDAPARATA